jgi:hypothetical protein
MIGSGASTPPDVPEPSDVDQIQHLTATRPSSAHRIVSGSVFSSLWTPPASRPWMMS